jgi:hypothetical protein
MARGLHEHLWISCLVTDESGSGFSGMFKHSIHESKHCLWGLCKWAQLGNAKETGKAKQTLRIGVELGDEIAQAVTWTLIEHGPLKVARAVTLIFVAVSNGWLMCGPLVCQSSCNSCRWILIPDHVCGHHSWVGIWSQRENGSSLDYGFSTTALNSFPLTIFSSINPSLQRSAVYRNKCEYLTLV